MDNYSYNSYAESGDSSPRSREIDFENPSAWEDSQNQPPPNFKVKFMCSYGGKIHPRPHDNQLSYVGGETKILAVDRSVKFAQLLSKLVSLCDSDTISFKYQLPGEDLDALISVTNDDDLEHMMHEYDRLYRISPKPARLRIFIFPSLSQNPSLSSSVRSFGSEEGKSEKERFVEALNSAPILNPSPQPVSPVAPIAQPPQIPSGNADFLFGLEKANAMAAVVQNPVIEDPVAVSGLDERLIGSDPIQKHIQDLQRLRLEEQQLSGNYRRRSEDSLSGGYEGEYYRGPEKITQVPVSSPAVPYYTEKQQIPVGAYPTGTDQQQVYMIPAQAGPYHTQMVRPMAGAPTQSYYTIQRLPSEYYRDQQQQQQQMQQQQQQQMQQQQQQLQVQQQQQQHMQQQQQQMQQQQQQMYNMMPQSMAAAPPSMQPQKAAGYPEGYGMVRPVTSVGVGMVGEAAYAQMAYDNMGRQVIYTTQGTVMGAPAAAQVQAAATVAQYQAMATAGLNQEGGGKVIAKATQPSL